MDNLNYCYECGEPFIDSESLMTYSLVGFTYCVCCFSESLEGLTADQICDIIIIMK